MRSRYRIIKATAEWLVALTMLLVAAPLLLTCALLVKLSSPGPVFYVQTRLGKRGRYYKVYKLRTMVRDSEARTGPVWAVEDDPRVTPIGRFLRDTHLDEVPQLWNVLRGEMSLIGPRPERPEIVARIERDLPGYRDRLAVRPGLTGLAQVRLPPDSDLEGVRRKLQCDLYYVRHVSVWLDLRIAAATGFYLLGKACRSIGGMLIESPAARALRTRATTQARMQPTLRLATQATSLPFIAPRGGDETFEEAKAA